MAAGKHQQQGVVAAAAAEPGGVARRMWRVVRAVLYMLRRGLPSGRKLAMDLHLLLHRGKIAGRALGELFLAFHHGHHGHGHRHAAAFSYAGGGGAGTGSGGSGPFSCRALDPSLAVHEPAPRGRREVEFSCSNTPSSAAANVTSGGGLGLGLLGAGKRRRRRKDRDDGFGGYLQQQQQYSSSYYDAAEVARMFEMLNDDGDGCGGQSYRLFTDDATEPASASASSAATSATASPARLLYWAAVARGGGSPAPRSSSRVTTPRRLAESPAADGGAGVDRQADEFIRRFYEQLRAQRSAASTPDYYGYTAAASAAGPSPYATPRARRPAASIVAAGIA